VIHAGLYYPPNSLKAKLCVEGNKLLYDWCDEYDVPYQKIGKLLTANGKAEETRLLEIYENAQLSGASGLRFIPSDELSEQEPYLKCSKALLSENTGIIDSHRFMYSLESAAINKGCTIAYNTRMTGFDQRSNLLIVTAENPNCNSFEISCRHFVNSAGLYSDKIASLTGLDVAKEDLELEYWKGHYYKLSPSKAYLAKRLIYPVRPKDAKGLGIHLTKDMMGYIKFGPDAEYIASKTETYKLANDKRDLFFQTISTYLSEVNETDLTFDQIGIRPKLSTKNINYRDFYIQNNSQNDTSSIINLVGMESPGLTSSLAIAEYVNQLIAKSQSS
jgi:L-2-hydroxyglutarate oxidase LhgO